MKRLCILLLFLFGLNNAFSQSLNARFNSFFYTWERYDSLNTSGTSPSTLHVKGYQNLLLEYNNKQWSFNTLIQTEEDVINKIDKGFDYRFYNAYIKGNNLFNLVDLKLGRQYIYAGAGRGSIDGVQLKFKFGKNKEYQLAGFGGANTPLDYRWDNYPKNNLMYGAQFRYYGIEGLYAGVSYMKKKRQPEDYTTLRLDSLYNPKEVVIETSADAEELAGLDLDYAIGKKHNVYSKVYFDINQKKFYKIELNARIGLTNELKAFAGYQYRQPQITYNTIFWVFNYQQYQEIEGGLDYSFTNNINVFARAGYVLYESDNSFKIQAGINKGSYGLSFIKYTGYAGESDGISGYCSREIVKNILSMNLNLDYSNYKIGVYTSDRVSAFSGLLGVTIRPNPYISFDLQGQFITNEIYNTDTRFLAGFSYWLFKRF